MQLTTLAHHIDMDWLHEAFDRTRKDGASGIDGQTAGQYAQALDANLRKFGRACEAAASWCVLPTMP
jgi:hypothetical protein